jgi:hypothetical protein
MRNENSFKCLFQQAIAFGNENGVHMSGPVRMRRKTTVPQRFKDCIVTTSVGHREYINNEENFQITMYFPTIDSTGWSKSHRAVFHYE